MSPHSFLASFLVLFMVLKHRVCNQWSLVARTQYYPVTQQRYSQLTVTKHATLSFNFQHLLYLHNHSHVVTAKKIAGKKLMRKTCQASYFPKKMHHRHKQQIACVAVAESSRHSHTKLAPSSHDYIYTVMLHAQL